MPDRRQWIVLSVLVLAQLTVWRDNTMLNVALADTGGSGRGGRGQPQRVRAEHQLRHVVFAALRGCGPIAAHEGGEGGRGGLSGPVCSDPVGFVARCTGAAA